LISASVQKLICCLYFFRERIWAYVQDCWWFITGSC